MPGLASAITALLSDSNVVAPTSAQPLQRRATPAAVARLTTRELQVLRLIGHGLSNREIADQLVVTVRTVRFHVSNVLAKLGVRTRFQAGLLAGRSGLPD